MPEEVMPSQPPRELALGQVRAALRPSRIDPVEVREVLLVAKSLGFDPSELYLEAQENRPPHYQEPPPLQTVLPGSLLSNENDEAEPLE